MTSESDTEFVERVSRAIYDRNSTHKDADLIRLFDLARRGAAVQWRPISEARIELDDGRDVLLLTMDGPLIAHRERGRWLDIDGHLVNFITHWMPLPPPPAGETSDE